MGLQSHLLNTVLWYCIGETEVSLPGFSNFFHSLGANSRSLNAVDGQICKAQRVGFKEAILHKIFYHHSFG